MGVNRALECFGQIELTLPNGREVVGRVPTLRQQLGVMQLLERISAGNSKAQRKLVESFPKLVGLEDELNQLTMEEFFDVVNRFFGRRGSANEKTGQTTTDQELNSSSQNTQGTTRDEQTPTCAGQNS